MDLFAHLMRKDVSNAIHVPADGFLLFHRSTGGTNMPPVCRLLACEHVWKESIIVLLQHVCQTVRNPSKTAWKHNFCCADEPTGQFTFTWVTATTHSQSSGDPPAMCQEAAADVTRAVTARRGAGHALCLARLPRELDAIQVAVLLPLGCYGASWRASVGRVLPCHMSLTIAARDRTPGGSEWDVHCWTHTDWLLKLIASTSLSDLLSLSHRLSGIHYSVLA